MSVTSPTFQLLHGVGHLVLCVRVEEAFDGGARDAAPVQLVGLLQHLLHVVAPLLQPSLRLLHQQQLHHDALLLRIHLPSVHLEAVHQVCSLCKSGSVGLQHVLR